MRGLGSVYRRGQVWWVRYHRDPFRDSGLGPLLGFAQGTPSTCLLLCGWGQCRGGVIAQQGHVTLPLWRRPG